MAEDLRGGPQRSRRALTNVGGPVTLKGDPKRAAALGEALAVAAPAGPEGPADAAPGTPPIDAEGSAVAPAPEDPARAHVHGFHSYPARMHPLTARRLVEALSSPGAAVLDPFCGSGTVVVEARLAGRRAIGVDANPLAVRLARLKSRGVREGERARLLEGARQAAALADTRRKARSGPSHRYGGADTNLFDAHVLLELDGLRLGIDAVPDPAARLDLELVFSSILTKVSRRTSDSSADAVQRRIAAGYPARLFVKKTEELCRRLAEIEPALAGTPPVRVLEGDARELTGVADGSIDLVVTSPPYPGVYDYVAHHEARLRWLRLRVATFERAEIGARRHLDPLGAREGRARWQAEIGATFRALGRVLTPNGVAVLLLGDSVVAGAAVYAIDLVSAVASEIGLAVLAVASQARPHFHGPTSHAFAGRPREEHAILIGRSVARVRKLARPRR